MLNRKILPAFILVLLAFAVSGCVTTIGGKKVDASLLKGKKVALVTIVTSRKIRTSDEGSGGLVGLLKKASSKYQSNIDSTKILKHTMPIAYKWLYHNRYFHMVRPSRARRSYAYHDVKPDNPSSSVFTRNFYYVPKGYHYYKTKEKYQRLARDLHVDAVAYMQIMHMARMGGAVMGIGKRHADTAIVISIIDKEGNTLLSYSDHATSKGGFVEMVGATDMKRLVPYFEEATKTTFADLDKKLAGST